MKIRAHLVYHYKEIAENLDPENETLSKEDRELKLWIQYIFVKKHIGEWKTDA